MHFSAREVLEVYSDDLVRERPEAIRKAAERLIPNSARDREAVVQLANFLLTLPPAEEQEKILNRLTEAASEKRADISNFRWWDIMTGEHWLFADVVREGQTVLVNFIWKNVEKGKSSRMSPQHAPVWARDSNAPGGWRFEFDFAEYHDMVGAFLAWFDKPLHPPPRG